MFSIFIFATLVNTQTHTETAFDRLHNYSSVSWAKYRLRSATVITVKRTVRYCLIWPTCNNKR